MTASEFVTDLANRGMDLWVDGDLLRYKAPPEMITEEILAEIRSRKADIIAHLQGGTAAEDETLPEKRPRSAEPDRLSERPASDHIPQLSSGFLGRSGLKVSELGLGPYSSTMVAPGAGEEFGRLLDVFAEAGGNYLDLSNVYTRSEERVGEWLRGKDREAYVIASKVGMQTSGEGPNQGGLSRKHIMASIDRSLAALGSGYVDIYYTHTWDGGTPLEETLSALNDIVRAGKARYIGVSNFTGWQLQKAVDTARYMQLEPVVVLQAQYNLLDRYPEWEQLPVCRNEGLGMTAWGSLAAGWLTGRYRRGMTQAEEGDRIKVESQLGMWHNTLGFRDTERTWRTLDVLAQVAEEARKTPGQVALNWLSRQAGVVPILGPRNVDQLHEGLGAVGWDLTDDQAARLEAASQLPPIMPHVFIESVNPPDRI